MLTRNLMLAVGSLALAGGAHAAFISADSASASSSFANGAGTVVMNPTSLINGAGLDNLANGASALHHGTIQPGPERNLWHTGTGTAANTVADQFVDFTFNSAVDLTHIHIWQYSQDNNAALLGRGVDEFTLWVSTTGLVGDLVQIGGTRNLAVSTVEAGADANTFDEAAQTFDLNATGVLLVRLDINSNHNAAATDYVGLSEVHFEQVPEPGSLALLGLGGLAMLRRRRA